MEVQHTRTHSHSLKLNKGERRKLGEEKRIHACNPNTAKAVTLTAICNTASYHEMHLSHHQRKRHTHPPFSGPVTPTPLADPTWRCLASSTGGTLHVSCYVAIFNGGTKLSRHLQWRHQACRQLQWRYPSKNRLWLQIL
ncbi:hypothetical protein GmHk_15G044190 [Glycine max]|nr:hypothetical protein GmHk_15G044190 [Glycine max]